MRKILSTTLVIILFAVSIAKPAAAGCVAVAWTEGDSNRPIWKCWGAEAR
jgi:hypothetical protein